MTIGIVIGALGAAAVAGLGLTGAWRYVFAPFGIRPHRMTVRRLGLVVRREDAERVDRVLAAFAGGFNAMIARPSPHAWTEFSESLPVFFRPFVHEGAAMGYILRRLGRYSPQDFEDRIVRPRPEYRYLYNVGLGFWAGMQRYTPEKLARMVRGLDPLHGQLCYDGYGFKHAFFDYPKSPDGLAPLNKLTGYARSAAYQGVGRAFWFLFSGNPEMLIDRIASLKAHAADAAAGAGLASVFVHPDRLSVAQEFGRLLPKEWQDSFHLGMCFGLKARSINDLDEFERNMKRAGPAVSDAAWASIRFCDRAELVVRDELKKELEGGPIDPVRRVMDMERVDSLDAVEMVMELEDAYDMTIPDEKAERLNMPREVLEYFDTGRMRPASEPYRDWRALVTEWMSAHIEFPMMSVKPAPAARERATSALGGR